MNLLPPKISIIMATYNSGNTLSACLESIAIQSFTDYEIVIIDGKSSDETLHIIEKYSRQLPIKYSSEKDNGIYDALNKGTQMATGKWLYFIGSDDQLLAGFSEMAELLEVENGFYYGDCTTTDPNMMLVGPYSNYKLAKHNICHHSIFYPKSVFKIYHYETAYKVYADHLLNIKIWADPNFEKIYKAITIAQFNLTGFSSQNTDLLFKKNQSQIIRKYLGMVALCRFKIRTLKSIFK